MPHTRQGFTLIELSIVIVVIGLLIGGIVAGRSLIQGANLRALSAELGNYQRAVMQFREDYNALPGDMAAATTYWGSAGGTGADATCYNLDKRALKTTCNGNGDGMIMRSNPATGVADGLETYLAWQHLSLADLVGGTYSGVTYTPGTYGTIAGINAPKGKMAGSTFMLQSLVAGGGNICLDNSYPNYFAGCYGTILYFGTALQSTTFIPGALMTPDDMYSLDKKLDDGFPGYGQLRSIKSLASCQTDAENYALGSKIEACSGMFGIDPIRPYS